MKKMTFESGLEELTALVRAVEGGELTLEDTLKAYEKGSALSQKLSAMLNEGKGRIEVLEADGTRSTLEGMGRDEDL